MRWYQPCAAAANTAELEIVYIQSHISNFATFASTKNLCCLWPWINKSLLVKCQNQGHFQNPHYEQILIPFLISNKTRWFKNWSLLFNLDISTNSTSNLTTKDSFVICSSWGFRNCSCLPDLIKILRRYRGLKRIVLFLNCLV